MTDRTESARHGAVHGSSPLGRAGRNASTRPPPKPVRVKDVAMAAKRTRRRLVVVANRLPVNRVKRQGTVQWETSPGGLVAALRPILESSDCCWVGWPGFAGTAPKPFTHDHIAQRPVSLSTEDLDAFYLGFCNGTIWPLYHDAVRSPEFHRHWWRPYVAVNRRFAAAAAEVLKQGDTVWIHDYQLQLVPAMLRELRPDVKIGFFLHIPFPPEELFAQLPWRRQILVGLLGADVVGFQTRPGAKNFARAAREFTSARGSDTLLEFDGRAVRVGAFPISIDVNRYADLAASPEVQARAAQIKRQLSGNRQIILGVDRLDYTKGIDTRLRAYETLLDRNPQAAKECVLIQVAVPTREKVREYVELRTRIEQWVGHINGRYGEPGFMPVQYLYRSLPVEKLVAYYLAASIMVVTPLRDGMNLVAKEYVATRLDHSGVLVLSEFAGAARELRGALLVNPHDIDGLASALEAGLRLPEDEAKRRMKALRRTVIRHDVHAWARTFLETLAQ